MSRKNRNRGGMIPTLQARHVRLEAEWSGPLPHPEALTQYNQVVPDAAERIISMAETQHNHRIAIEKKVVDSNISAQKLGTILGFVIAMTAILGGIYLIHSGKESSGLTSIISALVALAGVFVYGKTRQRKELDEKNRALSVVR